jgi:protein-tyrosine phosphatase
VAGAQRRSQAERRLSKVLFVCTGNIFRSLTADYALRGLLAARADIEVRSAGTDDRPHLVWPYVAGYLKSKGLDVSGHRRRTLTRAIVDDSTLVIAMSTDHRDHIRERYSRAVPLFLEACGEGADWLPDIDEVVPDWRNNQAGTEAHIRLTIDRIIELAPRMSVNIDNLLATYGHAYQGEQP